LILPWLLGIISAWHGGRIHGGDPKALKNLAWCLIIAVPVGIYCPAWSLVFVPLCYLKTMGHGRIWRPDLPLDVSKEPEKIEYLIGWLHGRVPDLWYKTAGMALVGLAACSGAVIAFAIASPLAGLAVAVGGLFKGVNALIFREATEVREAMDGVAVGCGILAGIAVL